MADTVRYLLEESIPELEDLESKGYFSRAEIKQIVQKRQDFEYLLKRRAALKQDFYRYIDYETKLEELRLIRKKKLGIKGQKTLAEVAIPRRIHFIYERAARKFKSDLDLWLRWIELCKKLKSTKRLSKVVTKALQRHATTPILWIEAACWEFDHNSNVAAARALMQQGIRMCRGEEDIWVEYFRLELLYVAKLRARREVLGLMDQQGQEQAPPAGGDADGGAGGAAAEGADASAAAVQAVLSGAVARVVFRNAVEALPSQLGFRARFLAVLAQFGFGGIASLREQVLASVRADFGQVPEAYDLLARQHLPQQHAAGGGSAPAAAHFDEAAHDAACRVYQQGLAALQADAASATSPAVGRLYELYSRYLCEAVGLLMAGGAAGAEVEEGAAHTQLQQAVRVAAQLFELLQQAHSAGVASAAMYLTWVDWAEKVKQPKMALKAARKACERLPGSALVWQRRLQLELSLHGSRQHSTESLFATLAKGLQATQATEEAQGLWLMAVQALPAASQEFASLVDMLETACALTATRAPSGGLGEVAASAVQKTRDECGLERACQLSERLLRAPGAGGDLYRCALRIEREAAQQEEAGVAGPSSSSAAAPQQRQRRRQRVSALYDAAVAAYGATESDLWLGFAQWAAACGQGVGQVYWRASKELGDPTHLVEAFRDQQLAPE